jgi:long-chain acyl-CoA synthetase
MNIAHLLLGSSREFSSLPALARGTASHLSYRDLWRKVSVMSMHLSGRFGLERGDRVAFAMTNCVEAIEVMYAVWHAGLCAVPMNAKLHAKEFAFILENSGAKLCFVTPDLAGTIAEAARESPALKEIVDVTTRSYGFMEVGDPIAMAETEATDPAWLFYTSGTTGRPKGATLTHRNLLAMTLNYFADVDRPPVGGSMVHAAPISHGSGLWNFAMVTRGVIQVFPESGKYEVPETVELMNRWPQCSIFLAPTMVKRLIEHGSVSDLEPDALRLISYGGAPMYVADLKRALDLLGDKLAQLYGQGESPMTITHLSREMHADRRHPRWEQRLASAGRPDSCVAVKVVDEEGRSLPVGEVGEIIVKGDTVMSGYWNDPAATAKSLRDGWLWTGDVGAFDEEGLLTLKDRSKDMIISGGSNIYPREIEDVLNLHPAVAECSVVGRPHPEWGEEVVAFVVPRPGKALRPAELDQLCLDNIARFKRPKDYKFIEALPKNNYGKILKTELRKLL